MDNAWGVVMVCDHELFPSPGSGQNPWQYHLYSPWLPPILPRDTALVLWAYF
ncbi:MAG: hypothetical protein MUC85_05070 [Anaerolineales bacterium]|nr:hypothetical protein [Anaerolineales bacterium]